MVSAILEASVLATAEEHLAVSVKQQQVHVAGEFMAAGVCAVGHRLSIRHEQSPLIRR